MEVPSLELLHCVVVHLALALLQHLLHQPALVRVVQVVPVRHLHLHLLRPLRLVVQVALVLEQSLVLVLALDFVQWTISALSQCLAFAKVHS